MAGHRTRWQEVHLYGAPWIPHGRSLRDWFEGDRSATIVVHSDLGERDEIPVGVWFREPEQFWPIERAALDLCRGRVLDVGAGTGCHALALQERGLEVCAIDFVPEAVRIMRRRGVRDVRRADLYGFAEHGGGWDTVLVLSNGAGLAETLAGLAPMLGAFDRLLAPRGRVLIDSTDLRPAADARGRRPTKLADGRYVGEIQFQLEYRGRKAPPFAQLYVDPDTLRRRAAAAGWNSRVVARGEGESYLARLTRARRSCATPVLRHTGKLLYSLSNLPPGRGYERDRDSRRARRRAGIRSQGRD